MRSVPGQPHPMADTRANPVGRACDRRAGFVGEGPSFGLQTLAESAESPARAVAELDQFRGQVRCGDYAAA